MLPNYNFIHFFKKMFTNYLCFGPTLISQGRVYFTPATVLIYGAVLNRLFL